MKKFILLPLLVLINSVALAEPNIFVDPDDGYLDASRWLFERRGFIPVPLIITEPAVGFGGGAALLFMDRNDEKSITGKPSPPTLKGVGAVTTSSQSQASFVFYKSSFVQDRWRYLGAAGVVGLNLTFYGLQGFPSVGEAKLDYSLDGWGVLQDLRYRLSDSNWFFGGRYIYSDLKATFKNQTPAFLSGRSIENHNAGLAVILNYDARENTMSPQEGLESEIRYFTYADYLGGDLNYNKFEMDVKGYWKWSDQWGGGVRVQGESVMGTVPFYAIPFINLRGIAKQRYQGEKTGSVELELRFRPELRWQYSVFAGEGKARSTNNLFDAGDSASSYGAGFRYLMARLAGFEMGLDVARGPEESIVYIQAGSAW